MATNLIPGRHLRFHDIDIDMYLFTLEAICWRASREDQRGRDFERVLLLWAGGDQDDEAPPGEELIAGVSAKLQAAHLWKMAFGFLPLIGPIMGFIIDGSMAARFYRLAHEYYEQRQTPTLT